MKRFAIIFLIVSGVVFGQLDLGISLAYPREIVNVCNSAAIASGTTWFNADFIDTLNDPVTHFVDSAYVYWSTDNGASWGTRISMTNIGGTYYPDTWQASRVNAASGSVRYYTRCITDSTITTQCPDNTLNTIPLNVNYCANIEPGRLNRLEVEAGRSWNTYDLTNFWVGYDSDEFFFRVNLAAGWLDRHFNLFPYYNYYHLLAIPIFNNESPVRDSVYFAVVVANISLIVINITDGLYKFWKEADPSAGGDDDPMNNYQRLGSVTFSAGPDNQTDFSIRFPISMLTTNGWGAWPNSTRVIGVGCATASAWLVGTDSVAYKIHDATKASAVYCLTQTYTIGTNTKPTISAVSASHTTNRDTTRVRFTSTYTDGENNLPTVKQLSLRKPTVATYNLGSADHRYNDGSIFSYVMNYRCEYRDTFEYKFRFNDGELGDSTSWLTYVVPQNINLAISPANWTVPGLLGSNDTVQMAPANGFTITNIGNVPVDLGLAVVSLPNFWVPFTYVNWDTTVIYGYFNDASTPPAFSTFSANDAILNSIAWADATRFGPGGRNISFCVDGAVTEKLWLSFIVPRYYASMGSQSLRLALWSRTSLP